MHSLKMKFLSLGLAVGMTLSFAGCAMSAPASVGSIGEVEIPAGIYLLAQYNAYNTAANAAELATGETASDVKAVLKAQCTGNIGDEEVTASGEEYVKQLTQRSLEYYAAVETKFNELGGTLSEEEIASAGASADSMWESSGDLYEKNGIGKDTLKNYLLNGTKADKLADLLYGEDGVSPLSDEELSAFVTDECYYIEAVEFPLLDYSTYSFATEEQAAEIEAVADSCLAELAASATGETAQTSAVYNAAMTYVPQAMSVLGSEMDAGTAIYYGMSQLALPDDLASYGSGETNSLTDPLDEAGEGKWVKIDLGMYYMVARKLDPLTALTLDDIKAQYDLVVELKWDEVEAQLYEEGAALPHSLNAGAMNTYSAGKIKKD